jgi:hypothetical protein
MILPSFQCSLKAVASLAMLLSLNCAFAQNKPIRVIKSGGVEVRIFSIERWPGREEGDSIYVTIDALIKNVSRKLLPHLGIIDLYDEKGKKYIAYAIREPTLPSNSLKPGSELRGYSTYKVDDLFVSTFTVRLDLPSEPQKPPLISKSAESALSNSSAVFRVLAVQDDIKDDNQLPTKPRKDHRFVAVRVEFDNRKGDASIRVGDFGLSLRDDDGNTYPATTIYPPPSQNSPSLLDEDLTEGDLVKGWVFFQVRTNVSFRVLRIRYHSIHSQSTWIKLPAN